MLTIIKKLLHVSLPKLAIGIILGLGIASLSTKLNDKYYDWQPDSYWPGLVGFIVFNFYILGLQALIHVSKPSVNHFGANVERAVFATVSALVIHGYDFQLDKIILLIAFAVPWFGLVFNLWFNYLKQLPITYLGGSEGKKSALVDRIFSKIKLKVKGRTINIGGEVLILVELILCVIIAKAYLS